MSRSTFRCHVGTPLIRYGNLYPNANVEGAGEGELKLLDGKRSIPPFPAWQDPRYGSGQRVVAFRASIDPQSWSGSTELSGDQRRGRAGPSPPTRRAAAGPLRPPAPMQPKRFKPARLGDAPAPAACDTNHQHRRYFCLGLFAQDATSLAQHNHSTPESPQHPLDKCNTPGTCTESTLQPAKRLRPADV